MALIDNKSEYFNKYDIEKLKVLSNEAKLKVFYELDKYPETTWYYHNILGIGAEVGFPYEEKLKFWKHLCEKDLFYFAKYILKKNLLCEKPNREMAEKIIEYFSDNELQEKMKQSAVKRAEHYSKEKILTEFMSNIELSDS